MLKLVAPGENVSQLGRIVREPTVQTAAAVISAPALAAGLNAVGVSTDLDPRALGSGLLDLHLWLTLSMVAGFGALGGVVAELLSLNGNVELPHRVHRVTSAKRSRLADPKNMVDLGILSRLLLGATAALAVLSVFAPTSATALVVNALIAGSAATGVFRLVQARLLGAIPKREKRERRLSSVEPADSERAA